MIRLLNRFLNTWAARGLFLVLLLALLGWGVSDMLHSVGGSNALAKVGGRAISDEDFEAAFRQQMAQVVRTMPGGRAPTPDIRRGVADQVLDRLIYQAAIADEVARLRIVVPDEALRHATFDMPAFKDDNGHFDRARFDQLLRANGLREDRFFALMRADLSQQELMESVRVGVRASDLLTLSLFRFQFEKRVADSVTLPFASATPATPDQAALQRWYDNHPELYTAPEYRHVKAVVLAPETLARSMDVSDEELHTAYDQRKQEWATPEKRDLEVIVTSDEATAKTLAAQWFVDPNWEAIQRDAQKVGASAVKLDAATRDQLPSPELTQAVFAARTGEVVGPLHGAMGWQIARVGTITPATGKSFEQARAELHDQIALRKAADAVYERSSKVQDALASGGALDDLPGDLGLAGLGGTMDAQGITPEGDPAPIPGGASLRTALIATVFAAHAGDAPHFTQVQGEPGQPAAYYAVIVDKIIPPARKPLAEMADQVKDDWIADQRHHLQEQIAARLYVAVKSGHSLKDAATQMGLPVSSTGPVGRQDSKAVPQTLARELFRLKSGQGTMVETPIGFVVAQLNAIQVPQRQADPVAFDQLRDRLTASISNDTEMAYATALRTRAQPQVNSQKLNQMIQASGS